MIIMVLIVVLPSVDKHSKSYGHVGGQVGGGGGDPRCWVAEAWSISPSVISVGGVYTSLLMACRRLLLIFSVGAFPPLSCFGTVSLIETKALFCCFHKIGNQTLTRHQSLQGFVVYIIRIVA